ncbi:MAG: prephenate dehydratase [Phycisphaeraceae bacterium]|nr:MAG: prephenate dehydratase [Phycisphaeraceae bacterium]
MPQDESEQQGKGSGDDADSGAPGVDAAARLEQCRVRIDEIDKRLVELLNERAGVVVEVGNLKRGTDIPIYAPHREADVLRKALAANMGPLPDRTIEGVFRELMSGSFALEQPLRIGYLGPQGSFSHAAATAHFGSSVEFADIQDIAGVFMEVRRGHADYGLVPIENSTGGGIIETLDAFRDSRDVTIYAEVLVTVRHNLLANCEPGAVKQIHSKPEIFTQCRRWLSAHYPNAEQIAAPSSSRAVMLARQAVEADPGAGVAAIGSELAGQIHGVNLLYQDIEDNPNNITRFLVVAKQAARPSGDDKTSIMFITLDKPGALVSVLSVFERAGVNLSHIEKRPSGRENWRYTFFIDAQGHRDDPSVAYAIREAAAHCQELTVLGSYPRATRIL